MGYISIVYIFLQLIYICQVTQAFNKFDTSGDNRCVLGTSTMSLLLPGIFQSRKFYFLLLKETELSILRINFLFFSFIVTLKANYLWTKHLSFPLCSFTQCVMSIILTSYLLNINSSTHTKKKTFKCLHYHQYVLSSS